MTFAVLPAAGDSRRMGEDKLLLPWRGATVVDAVINAWRDSGVTAVVAVANPRNQRLIAHLHNCGIDVVVPDRPPAEMKHSVQLALQFIAAEYRPTEVDCWLLAPADMPQLSPAVIRNLIEAAEQMVEEIAVPTHGGRRGHPVIFRWALAEKTFALADNEGVNSLFARHPVMQLDLGVAGVPADIDTPEDYERLHDASA